MIEIVGSRVTFRFKVPRVIWRVGVWCVLKYRRIRYGDGYRRIELSQGYWAKVDVSDYEKLRRYRWRVRKGRNTWYAERSIKKEATGKYSRVLMHRDLVRVGEGYVIDHKNGDGLDNRRVNLRIATVSENAANSRLRRNNTSGYKGVWWDKGKRKYRAGLWAGEKRYHLGYYDSKEDAARAYDAAAKKHFGEYASLNMSRSG